MVNELSSTVSVYEYDVVTARGLARGDARPTLRFVQSVSTIPSAFPKKLNTCGRICVDPTGRQAFLVLLFVAFAFLFFPISIVLQVYLGSAWLCFGFGSAFSAVSFFFCLS